MTKPTTITIAKDGPYLVFGAAPLAVVTIEINAAGESEQWGDGNQFPLADKCALCRCGESNDKPFCDGTHAKIGFDGTETASTLPFMQQAEVLDGPVTQLADVGGLCAFARYCDPNGQVWSMVQNSDDPSTRANLIRQSAACPSGRLVAIDKVSGAALEPELPPSIGIVEDPAMECSGPLWVRGGIELIGANGAAYEVRNRVTLCRCGRSENKPFCDGAHAADPKFRDALA